MKKIIIYTFIAIGLIPSFVSCEGELPIGKEGSHGIIINALATTDSVLAVSVTDAYRYDQVNIYSPYFYLAFDKFLREPTPEINLYIEKFNSPDATVEMSINGGNRETIPYNAEKLLYTTDYRPKAGDEIELSVSAEGRKPVTAKVVVPEYQPSVELLNFETRYEPYNRDEYYSDNEGDSVYYLTLKMKDRVETRDFYRLKVRKISYYYETQQKNLHFSDTYSSKDDVFYDPYLTKGYGGWPAHLSTVFTDEKFINGELIVTVAVRNYKLPRPFGKYIIIEQQSIPEDYYNYIKSFQLYRSIEPDDYSEIIKIHSNCSNNMGIFGAVSSKKLRIDF